MATLRLLGEWGGMARADLNVLAAATARDYVEALHALEGGDLVSIVRTTLDMRGDSYALTGRPSISEMIVQALAHIASEKVLNAVRVKNLYGVDPAPLPDASPATP